MPTLVLRLSAILILIGVSTGFAAAQPAGGQPSAAGAAAPAAKDAAGAPAEAAQKPAAPEASSPTEPKKPATIGEQAVQAREWVQTLVRRVTELATEYGLKVLGALVVLIIAFFAAGWAKRATRTGLDKAKFDPTISKFGSNVAKYLVVILGVLTCAPIMGINITAFAAVLGVGGLAVGLGSQGAVSNLAAGLMLLVTRPFKVGDLIVVDGVSGIVEEIELFTTKLNTPDNRRIFMPNNSIFGKVIENSTHNPQRATTFSIMVAADSNVEAVRETLKRAIESCPLVLGTPAAATIVSNMEGGGLKWDITCWAETPKLGLARDQAIIAVRDAIAAAQIKAPLVVTNVRTLENK